MVKELIADVGDPGEGFAVVAVGKNADRKFEAERSVKGFGSEGGCLTRDEIVVIAGRARMAKLSPQERSDLARKAGKIGGVARALKLSPERRKEIASHAAKCREIKRDIPIDPLRCWSR